MDDEQVSNLLLGLFNSLWAAKYELRDQRQREKFLDETLRLFGTP